MPQRRPLVSTLGALGLTGAAVVLSLAARPLAEASPFSLFLLAALLASRWFGIGAGLAATAAGGLAAQLLFAAPRAAPGAPAAPSGLRLALFLGVSAVACWIVASLRDARTPPPVARDTERPSPGSRRLLTTLAALARSNRELEQFARTAAHELVQPLGTITNHAQLIKEQSDGEAQRNANRILELGSRMGQMLRQHLDRARTLGDPGSREPTSLQEALVEVERELSGDLAGKGSSVMGEGLPVVDADPVLMRQLMHSLISSALRDGAPGRLEFRARSGDGECAVTLTIDVRDPDACSIQTRLERDDEFGIAKSIIELHGGRAWTEPGPGRGARIHFTLPAAKAVRSPA